MTTRVPIRYGGTGANTAASARTALGVPPLAAYDVANNASAQANNARQQANTARNTANDAYNAANTKLPLSGGTISGDLVVSGNLTISGNSTTLNTESLIVEDAEIVLLSNVAGSPVLNSGLIINRGSSTNTFLRWNENADKWGWSDDGTTFYSLDTSLTAYAQANAAYGQANLAYAAANNAAVKVTANSGATISSNTISFNNTATVSVVVEQNGQNANISFVAAPQTVVVDTYTAAGNTTAAATANIANGLYALVTDAANTVRVSQNGISTLSAKQLNLVNTSSVFIRVDDAGNGNANISFSAPGTNTYIRSEVFTSPNGDGNLVYTLNAYPFRESYVLVNKNGVALVPNTDFSLSNNLLTVIETGETGDTIDVRYWVDASTLSSNSTTIFIQANTPVSQTSTFTLAHNVTAINLVTVSKNGLRLTPNSHYTLSGNTITLTTPAEANDQILFEYFYDLGTLQYKLGFIRNSFVGDGSTQSFVLDTTPSNEDNCLVFVDRVLQRNSEYDVTASTLTFTGAPDSNAVIDVFITTQLTANNGVIKTGDTMTGNLNVAATLITQNVEPSANITYNLGTNTKRFKDIYLSNSTIYLGDSTISAQSGNITFGGANVQLSNVSAKLNVANDVFVSGNVGIGTTNPSEKFEVYSGGISVNNGTIKNILSYTSQGIVGTTSNHALVLYANNSERMRITTNGNVGIGTTNPTAQLCVGHDAHGVGVAYLGANALPSIAGIFTSNGAAGGTGFGDLLIKARTDYGGYYNVIFYTATTDNTPVERFRINPNGHLERTALSWSGSPNSYSAGQSVVQTSSGERHALYAKKDLGIIETRAFHDYMDFKTNITSDNIMFWFEFIGYQYNGGVSHYYGGGYTYTGNAVIAKATGTGYKVVGGDYVYDFYRASDGSLCVKLYIGNQGYDEGRTHVFFSAFDGNVARGCQIIASAVYNSTSNYY